MLKYAALIFVGSYAMGATCESLSSLSIPHTTIVAESVAAGAFAPPAPAAGKGKAKGGGNPFADLAAFCRVQVTSKPSADSDIKIEYWLPAAGWNGNFEANGNGGWSGSITPNTLAAGMQRGYAAAMTDTGHEGGSASFAMGHPEKVIDFGYRAVHEMATTGKTLIKAFYGRDAKHSYWNGCSAGGRQGLMEAQRYPEDFDAIVAGSPAINFTGRSAQAVWIGQATHKDESSALPQAKFAVIHDAALEACDGRSGDGVKDGVLDDPTKCKFDPKTLECKGADAPTCLTAAQVETVRKIYSDVVNPRTKSVIFEGHEPGSENGWTTMAGNNVFTIATDTFKYAVFEDTNWDYKTLNFDSDMEKTEQKTGKIVNALDPNLKPFLARGGKIIQYHGWADPQISPRSSVDYYKSVTKAMGGSSKINDNYRLFMIPGMAHCGGGDATANFDMLAALEQWVDTGKAPDRIEASRVRNGQTDRTRPLCPYPQVASYKGSGSTDDTANFVCK
ncbi:MAG TPA: tannase/feruloyl esterase family alpha/beta hydrolase [Bryobacteraceae bacterium]|jgi:feruloyl esterase|nr:tannase/feruloyl esterase family alpha/beta hydrolase [Bryobacteraceae bacterium]